MSLTCYIIFISQHMNAKSKEGNAINKFNLPYPTWILINITFTRLPINRKHIRFRHAFITSLIARTLISTRAMAKKIKLYPTNKVTSTSHLHLTTSYTNPCFNWTLVIAQLGRFRIYSRIEFRFPQDWPATNWPSPVGMLSIADQTLT